MKGDGSAALRCDQPGRALEQHRNASEQLRTAKNRTGSAQNSQELHRKSLDQISNGIVVRRGAGQWSSIAAKGRAME